MTVEAEQLALEEARRILADAEQSLGKTHPVTLECWANCNSMLKTLGMEQLPELVPDEEELAAQAQAERERQDEGGTAFSGTQTARKKKKKTSKFQATEISAVVVLLIASLGVGIYVIQLRNNTENKPVLTAQVARNTVPESIPTETATSSTSTAAVPSVTPTPTPPPPPAETKEVARSPQEEKDAEREQLEDQILNYQKTWDLEKLIPLYRKLKYYYNTDTDEYRTALRNYRVISNKLEQRETSRDYKTEVDGSKSAAKPGRKVGNQSWYRDQLLDAISNEMVKPNQDTGYYNNYYYSWRRRSNNVWDYKPAAPIVKVKIAQDGTPKNCSILVSSGDKEADKYCVDSIKKMTFPAIEGLAEGECLSFVVNIERSNAFQSSSR